MAKDRLSALLRSQNTVFTSKDLLLIWNETDAGLAKKYAYRYVKSGRLYSLRKGIYAKDENYDRFELANKIYTPAYISFESVLTREGVVFQQYDQIFVASYLSREIVCDGRSYVFRRLKESILLNSSGVSGRGNYHMATKERAFLDIVYLQKSYHFDNLSSLNWDECFRILPLYENNEMARRVMSYYRISQHA